MACARVVRPLLSDTNATSPLRTHARTRAAPITAGSLSLRGGRRLRRAADGSPAQPLRGGGIAPPRVRLAKAGGELAQRPPLLPHGLGILQQLQLGLRLLLPLESALERPRRARRGRLLAMIREELLATATQHRHRRQSSRSLALARWRRACRASHRWAAAPLLSRAQLTDAQLTRAQLTERQPPEIRGAGGGRGAGTW